MPSGIAELAVLASKSLSALEITSNMELEILKYNWWTIP